MLHRLRTTPLVFRIAGSLLIIAVIGGQFWQRDEARTVTREMVARLATSCPAVSRDTLVTIGDGARALAAAAYRIVMDRLRPNARPRCGRSSTSSGASGARSSGHYASRDGGRFIKRHHQTRSTVNRLRR